MLNSDTADSKLIHQRIPITHLNSLFRLGFDV